MAVDKGFMEKILNKGGKPMINGKRILVALDDGHGIDTAGKRTPTLPNNLKSEIGRPYMNENLFNRAVVAYVDEHLRYIGFDTLLVAPTDADTPLETRTALANARKANIYISIHANALNGQWGGHGGIETFYYPSTESRRLSDAIHKQVLKGTQLKNRGLKNGSHLWVLRKTNMPATLVELGFMDSLLDYQHLLKDAYRRESAREIVMGVCDYYGVKFKEMPKQTTPVTNPTPKPNLTSHGKPILQMGAKGNDVREMQMLLIRHGIKIVADGDFGMKTKDGVMQFQRAKKIQVDGSVGEQTWGELLKPVAKPPAPTPPSNMSLVDYLKSIGKPSDFNSRAKLAKEHGINNYTGTEQQNIDLLTKLRNPVKPAPKPTPAKPAPAPLKEHQYRAVKGDTLWSIGNRFGLTVAELQKQNPNIKTLKIGDIVNVKPTPKPAPPKPTPPKPAPKPAPPKDEGVTFRVVAGSFSSMKDANARVAYLKGKGYSAFVSPFSDKGKMNYRVVVGSFESRDNAEARMNALKKIGISSFLVAMKK